MSTERSSSYNSQTAALECASHAKASGDLEAFKVFNVRYLNLMAECKLEIIALVRSLQRSLQIVFSSHKIFKDYVTDKLVHAQDPRSSQAVNPAKKKVRTEMRRV